MSLRTLKSQLDKSVNWVIKKGSGHLEARYVRRDPKYISAYVSSHNGCKMACKMCFLTQLNQKWFYHSTLQDYTEQFNTVLDYYDTVAKTQPAERVNVNFMARGEALANKTVMGNFAGIYDSFLQRSQRSNLKLKMNVSTIMPYTVQQRKLSDILGNKAEIYYSLYSVDDKFRKLWLPNAMPYKVALNKLKEYQEETKQLITFHWAFIEGQNDKLSQVKDLAKVLKEYEFTGKFNLVRYNAPPSLEHTKEPDEDKLKEYVEIINESLIGNRSKIVPRVGKDVYASCGMFIQD